MKLFKNRTVLGIVCIVLSLLICFGVTPLFNRAVNEKTTIVRVKSEISTGDQITEDMVEVVEVGGFNLPQNIIRDADNVLRLVSCDLKSISYLSSQLPLFQRSGFEFDNHYKVASNVKPHHNEEQMSGALGRLAFSVPHSPEVEEQYLQGNLLSELTMKNSRAFRKEVQKITREVFNL